MKVADRSGVYTDVQQRTDTSPGKGLAPLLTAEFPSTSSLSKFHDEHNTLPPPVPPCCSVQLPIKGKMTFQNSILCVVGVQVGGFKRFGE